MDFPNTSRLLQTALTVIDGYNKWDINAIMAPRAPNCTQQVFPTRLGRPLLNNAQYREYFGAFIPHFKYFTVEICDVVEDPKNHKVCLHARSSAQTAIGSYANEYMILMQMTDDDERLLSFKEFVDSGNSEYFFGRLERHIKEARSKARDSKV